MKNFIRLTTAAVAIFFAASNPACAQATGTATASVTIVTPISVAKTTDMSFGNIAVSVAANGTVEMTPAGTRTSTGGVTLPAASGTVAAASFTISGQANYTFAITLPTSVVSIINGQSTMDVHTFTSFPASVGTLSAGGTNVMTVGAKLDVNAGQPAGIYTTATPFSVTVSYN